jgi:hypothetical protein
VNIKKISCLNQLDWMKLLKIPLENIRQPPIRKNNKDKLSSWKELAVEIFLREKTLLIACDVFILHRLINIISYKFNNP